jgi:hypothetical protein
MRHASNGFEPKNSFEREVLASGRDKTHTLIIDSQSITNAMVETVNRTLTIAMPTARHD